MKNTVQDYVYESRSLSGRHTGHQNDPELCQFSVSTHERWTSYHQCSRKATMEVDGVGFCKQHGEEVRHHLGYAVETNVCFVANFRNGEPKLTKVYFSKQTESMITIEKWEEIIGDMFMMTGSQKKYQRYTNYNFFNTQAEAIQWLHQESMERYSNLIEQTEQARETMKKLEAMVKNES